MEFGCGDPGIIDDIFQCGHCKVAFTSLGMFLHHKREACAPPTLHITDDGMYAIVPSRYNTDTDVSHDHTEIKVSRDKSIKETAATSQSTMTSSFSNHYSTAEKNLHKCTQCSKSFKKSSSLLVHMRMHDGEKPFQCPVCARCFSQNTHLQRHIQGHRVWPDGLSCTVPATLETTPSSYSCAYCTLVLPDYAKFRIHLKNHIAHKKFKCIHGECSDLFKELGQLIEHTLKSHPNATYSCHLCDYKSSSLEDSANHQKNHPKEGPQKTKSKFTCLQCDASFGKLEKLTFHASIHNHVRTCSRCKKRFSSEKRLRSHLRTHEDIKPFKCTVCSATFRIKKYLTTHMLRHAERIHSCSFCNLKFKRKDLLDRHCKIHQPRKMMDCPFKEQLGCTSQFTRKDKMKYHLKSHVKKLTSTNAKKRKTTTSAKSVLEIVIIPVTRS